jgi:hypothetical protein
MDSDEELLFAVLDDLNDFPPNQQITGDDEQLYLHCVEQSIQKLRNLQPRPGPFFPDELWPSLSSSPQSKGKRLEVGRRKLIHFDIFPWFRYLDSKGKIRATNNHATIARVVDAMNYFWGRSYDEAELVYLQSLFVSFAGAKDDMKEALSRIVTVFQAFTAWLGSRGGAVPPPPAGDPWVNHSPGPHGKTLQGYDTDSMSGYLSSLDDQGPDPGTASLSPCPHCHQM